MRFQDFQEWELIEIKSGLLQQAYYSNFNLIKTLLDECDLELRKIEKYRIDALPKCECCKQVIKK